MRDINLMNINVPFKNARFWLRYWGWFQIDSIFFLKLELEPELESRNFQILELKPESE